MFKLELTNLYEIKISCDDEKIQLIDMPVILFVFYLEVIEHNPITYYTIWFELTIFLVCFFDGLQNKTASEYSKASPVSSVIFFTFSLSLSWKITHTSCGDWLYAYLCDWLYICNICLHWRIFEWIIALNKKKNIYSFTPPPRTGWMMYVSEACVILVEVLFLVVKFKQV